MANNPVRFRPEQEVIVHGYHGGKLGISAVPGSGKTFTLSHLAAQLVERLTAQGLIQGVDRREVLIVTFTNSAVNSFRSKIAEILNQERGLLPHIGYQVRTLHGLARDIVNERPSLAGLPEDFQIIDEREQTRIIREVALSVLGTYREAFAQYYDSEKVATDRQIRRLESHDLPRLAEDLGRRFIQQAKNLLLDPVTLQAKLDQYAVDMPLVAFGLAVYEDYQRSLHYRGAVDFDDLVRLAIVALENDADYLQRLRRRWPYILEDEAQDSSDLQEHMLGLLSGDGNWVRVGDPNQAINTTFTTADPRFLRDFLDQPGVQEQPLLTSGRSALPIIDLANILVQWTVRDHPVPGLRDIALLEQRINPTAADDPQPNPPQDGVPVFIYYTPGKNVSPEHELATVAANVKDFVTEHPNYTVAILAPENSRGFKMTELLRNHEVRYEELLRSTTRTRESASVLRTVLAFLGNPLSNSFLARLYAEVWLPSFHSELDDEKQHKALTNALARCRQLEQFLWPVPGVDWAECLNTALDEASRADLEAFRTQVQTWLEAAVLPIDQLVLAISQDLFTDPADIALGHKLAGVLRGLSRSNPTLRLPDYVQELQDISENQRKFIGFEDVEHGYEPRPGVVTVATMHAAKGLEWDRVYLLGVSNYGFPSAQPQDNYLSEKWFIRDQLNLEAETLAQLASVVEKRPYVEGAASAEARIDYAAERLRLLYVGITRARRSVVITWNMGRFWQKGGEYVNQPAVPLLALWGHTRPQDKR